LPDIGTHIIVYIEALSAVGLNEFSSRTTKGKEVVAGEGKCCIPAVLRGLEGFQEAH